jgi:hypothetical protein
MTRPMKRPREVFYLQNIYTFYTMSYVSCWCNALWGVCYNLAEFTTTVRLEDCLWMLLCFNVYWCSLRSLSLSHLGPGHTLTESSGYAEVCVCNMQYIRHDTQKHGKPRAKTLWELAMFLRRQRQFTPVIHSSVRLFGHPISRFPIS